MSPDEPREPLEDGGTGEELDAGSTTGEETTPVPGLSELYEDAEAPLELEGRVVEGLLAEGLLVAGTSTADSSGISQGGPQSVTTATHASATTRAQRPWLRAAASVLLFAVGWGARGAFAPAPDPPLVRGGEDYMLLVYGEPEGAAGMDPSAVAAEYEAWGQRLAEAGVGVTGNELAVERTPLGSPTLPPGTVPLTGYFLLSVSDGQDIDALIEDHPHLRYGGAMEVAPILRRN